ncbi:MAG TPA: hypothetical protein VKB78_03800 [Pirellulales bacterium]|nr:hypothetical protein [Pirellulales bacterium]
MKSLDQKLAAIHADPNGAKDFILADAKDADMAFGIGAPGKSPESHAGEVRLRTLAEYREQIRQVVRQGIVDIMLMSASTSDVLTIGERLFDNSHVTPAARANDTSDVFVVRGEKYLGESARPFRTATLDHIQCGHVDCGPAERVHGANLGLYSVTFNNRLNDDLHTLEEYRRFRIEAEAKSFRHFLEVFDPNAPQGLGPDQIPAFVNDHIARTLGGVARAGRPIFLKIVYHGPKSLDELVTYDPHLIVGILGGSAGTTYDAFKLVAEAQKYGARAALYGRKINNAECQLAFIEFLRLIVEHEITPEEAVRAYHGVLQQLKIRPHRSLGDDMKLQSHVMSYGSGARSEGKGARQGTRDDTRKATILPSGRQATAARSEAASHECACGGGESKECHCHEKKSQNGTPATQR